MRPFVTPWRTALTASPAFVCRQCLRSNKTPPRIPLQQFVAPYSSSTLSTPKSSSPIVASVRQTPIWQPAATLPPPRAPPRRRYGLIIASLLAVGAGALAFSERGRHMYIAAERCGRVSIAVVLNIREYLKVVQQQENWDDPDFQARMSQVHKRCAERAFAVMEKNGSIFIKLGQHLSSLNYLLPDEWCDTFVPLQDKCPVSSFASVQEMVYNDLGRPLEDIFSEFDPVPIGAASLAQVHVARLRDTGEQVAVKIQHPALDEWAKLDMWLTHTTFQLLKYFFPHYDLTWLSEEMEASLPKELDFCEEARNAMRTKEYFAKNIPRSPLVVPNVIWAERRVLVMEYIAGRRLDDLAFLDSNGISRDEVSAALARIFNEMIFGDGAPLHCDPHGGNLAIRVNSSRRKPRNFDIVLYDHGLYRDIPLDMRRAYAHMWLAVLNTDLAAMRHWAWEIARIDDSEFPIFASAITGRDYSVIARGHEGAGPGVTESRNAAEKRSLTQSLGDDLVEKLVKLLAKVPRIILLILKTNDLTRSLDENLHTSHGPARSFLILARYAARCVFHERLATLRASASRFSWWAWPPANFLGWSAAVWDYANIALRLRVFEYYLSARRRLRWLTGEASVDDRSAAGATGGIIKGM